MTHSYGVHFIDVALDVTTPSYRVHFIDVAIDVTIHSYGFTSFM